VFVNSKTAQGSRQEIIPGPRLQPGLPQEVDELELSVRFGQLPEERYIVYIGDLVQKSEAEMLRIRTSAAKSLNEIKEVLAQMGSAPRMKCRAGRRNIDELASASRIITDPNSRQVKREFIRF